MTIFIVRLLIRGSYPTTVDNNSFYKFDKPQPEARHKNQSLEHSFDNTTFYNIFMGQAYQTFPSITFHHLPEVKKS